MEDQDEFLLELNIKGKPVEIPGRLRKSAFTYQFLFDLDGSELIVEKDDQGALRAFAPGIRDGLKSPDPQLVQAILAEMNKLFGND